MAHNSIFEISAAGMAIERTRVELAALNLANAHTTQAAGQAAYQPLRVVGLPAAQSFAAVMQAAETGSTAMAPAFRIEASGAAPRRVHEPGHPYADEGGFVTYPGVDTATEMVTLLGATRAYEANVAAMNTTRHLALKALDIGGNS